MHPTETCGSPLHRPNQPRTFALPIRHAEQEQPLRPLKKKVESGGKSRKSSATFALPNQTDRGEAFGKSLLHCLQTTKRAVYFCSPLQPAATGHRRKAPKRNAHFDLVFFSRCVSLQPASTGSGHTERSEGKVAKIFLATSQRLLTFAARFARKGPTPTQQLSHRVSPDGWDARSLNGWK